MRRTPLSSGRDTLSRQVALEYRRTRDVLFGFDEKRAGDSRGHPWGPRSISTNLNLRPLEGGPDDPGERDRVCKTSAMPPKSSKFRGVTLFRPTKKWRAQISAGGKTTSLA